MICKSKPNLQIEDYPILKINDKYFFSKNIHHRK